MIGKRRPARRKRNAVVGLAQSRFKAHSQYDYPRAVEQAEFSLAPLGKWTQSRSGHSLSAVNWMALSEVMKHVRKKAVGKILYNVLIREGLLKTLRVRSHA